MTYKVNYYESTYWNPYECHSHSTILIITRAGEKEREGMMWALWEGRKEKQQMEKGIEMLAEDGES